ncbi:MAG: hypothetical protein IKE91_07955 [Clostridia bacterium]|nr:hypothetical protein [Clostridia bacterium]
MLKKYWSHILNIVFFVLVDVFIGICLMGIKNEAAMNGVPTIILPIMILIEFILAIGVFGEIIYGIVKAIQDKDLNNKALHIILIYFLNVFYIPCFLLKHVYEDKKVLVKNIVYLIIVGALYITLWVLALSVSTLTA